MGYLTETDLEAARDKEHLRSQGYTRAQMIRFLGTLIAPATKRDIRKKIMANPNNWCDAYHFGWGKAVRDELRHNGFSEEVLGIKSLGYVYVELIEEAVKK